jgi:hypothetical protein
MNTCERCKHEYRFYPELVGRKGFEFAYERYCSRYCQETEFDNKRAPKSEIELAILIRSQPEGLQLRGHDGRIWDL